MASPSLRVALAGDGALGMQVGLELRRLVIADVINCDPTVGHARLVDVDVALCCTDSPAAAIVTLASACRAAGVPLVVARLTTAGAAVYPVLADRTPAFPQGCPVCAGYHDADRTPAAGAPGAAPATHPLPPTHAAAEVGAAAQLVTLALCKALEISRGGRPADAQATRVDFDTHKVVTEQVTRHPACSLCFPPAAAQDGAPGRETPAGASVRSPSDRLAELRGLAGEHFGLFESVRPRAPEERQAVWQFFRERGLDPQRIALANAHAVEVYRPHGRWAKATRTASAGFDFDDAAHAEAVAIIEGLERLCTLGFCPEERLVQASYAEIADRALDPRQFPLYSEAQYQERGFPLQRFDPGACIAWVEARDFATGRPLLVPADFVFASRAATRIYRANSNGAACQAGMAQAIVNGIYENVERDALMLTWLNRLSLPRVTFDAGDPDPWAMRATLDQLDFDLQHVDITTDLGIPVLLAVLRDRRNPALLLLDMVAHADPHARLAKLYRELAQFLWPYLIDRQHFVGPCTVDPDPDRVIDFPDHVAFYQAPDRNRHAAFLVSAATARPFADEPPPAPSAGPAAELEELVARLAARGYPALVVDCTLPLLRELNLVAVKVLVPGLQPLNCGHRFRSLGGERALTIAQRMGLAGARRSPADLNPLPHPFW